MREVDSSIFKHELGQVLTLMPTILFVLQIIVNIYLINLENIDEVWFYIRDSQRGIKILNVSSAFSVLSLCLMIYFYMVSIPPYKLSADGSIDYSTTAEAVVEAKHILVVSFAMLHAVSMNLLAR